jgi:hypothetical protein
MYRCEEVVVVHQLLFVGACAAAVLEACAEVVSGKVLLGLSKLLGPVIPTWLVCWMVC